MKSELLARHIAFAPRVEQPNLGPIHGVEQGQQCDILTLSAQLLRDFIRDRATHAISTDQVWPVRTYPSNLLHVQSRHVFDFGKRRDGTVEALRLQTIKRLIRTQKVR